jgi:dTDP-4-amino-4,6-dideoxygalactose transaminase
MTEVPVAAPTRLAPAEDAAVHEAIQRVVRDGPWILGEPVERFEDEFAAYAGHPHVVGVANGTDALVLAFSALALTRGAGVLVAAVEGGYAATAARLAGLEPRVVDVDPFTMGPTPALAELADLVGVEALVVTHLHGDAVPIRELDSWRRRRGLALVEDCAQAHGLRVDGHHVGTTGDAATYSFYPTKNLGAVGDGGAVAFGDAAHARRARSLRQYGWGEQFRVDLAGGRNSRLDTLQAAILSARLPFLDERNVRRRAVAARLRDAVLTGRPGQIGRIGRLHGDARTTVAHHAVLVTDRRDQVREHLAARGVRTAVHYPYLVQEMPGLGVTASPTSAASALRAQILSLPCFPEMSDAEVDQVVNALQDVDA